MGFMDQINIGGQLIAASFNFAATGDNIIAAAVPGKKLAIYRLLLSSTGAQTLIFKDGAGTSLSGPMDFGALAFIFLDPTNLPWFETSAGNAFIINASAATKISGKVDYIVEL